MICLICPDKASAFAQNSAEQYKPPYEDGARNADAAKKVNSQGRECMNTRSVPVPDELRLFRPLHSSPTPLRTLFLRSPTASRSLKQWQLETMKKKIALVSLARCYSGATIHVDLHCSAPHRLASLDPTPRIQRWVAKVYVLAEPYDLLSWNAPLTGVFCGVEIFTIPPWRFKEFVLDSPRFTPFQGCLKGHDEGEFKVSRSPDSVWSRP